MLTRGLPEVASLALTIVAILWAVATHATSFSCPPPWWQPEPGICELRPVGGEHFSGRGWVDDSVQPPGFVAPGWHCTGGSRLRRVDDSVWCAR